MTTKSFLDNNRKQLLRTCFTIGSRLRMTKEDIEDAFGETSIRFLKKIDEPTFNVFYLMFRRTSIDLFRSTQAKSRTLPKLSKIDYSLLSVIAADGAVGKISPREYQSSTNQVITIINENWPPCALNDSDKLTLRLLSEECNDHEIAEALNISYHSARVKVYRLRKKLKPYSEDLVSTLQ